jgi:hypothetical protein
MAVNLKEYLIKADSWSYSNITSPACGIVDLPIFEIVFELQLAQTVQTVTEGVERSKPGLAGTQLVRYSLSRAIWAEHNRFVSSSQNVAICVATPLNFTVSANGIRVLYRIQQ